MSLILEPKLNIDFLKALIPSRDNLIFEEQFGDNYFKGCINVISEMSPFIRCINVDRYFYKPVSFWEIDVSLLSIYDIQLIEWYILDSVDKTKFLNILNTLLKNNTTNYTDLCDAYKSADTYKVFKSIVDVISFSNFKKNFYYFKITNSNYDPLIPFNEYPASINKSLLAALLKTCTEAHSNYLIDKSLEIEYNVSRKGLIYIRKLIIVGSSTYKRTLNKWFFMIKDIYDRKHSKPKTIKRIALITERTSKAYNDFIDFFKYSDIVIEQFTKLNYMKIAKKILELEDDDCQIICIIRGGGSKESLLQYSHPLLVNAIKYSSKYVVVGIGHADDTPLCEYFAEYAASTPTDAAYHIAYLLTKQQNNIFYDLRKPRHRCSI